jgi:hypothetical protein
MVTCYSRMRTTGTAPPPPPALETVMASLCSQSKCFLVSRHTYSCNTVTLSYSDVRISFGDPVQCSLVVAPCTRLYGATPPHIATFIETLNSMQMQAEAGSNGAPDWLGPCSCKQQFADNYCTVRLCPAIPVPLHDMNIFHCK